MASLSRPPATAPSPALQDPLSAFPQELATTVLLAAGPHTRQVSRAYRALHPPRLALAPHGTTLEAALPTLPSTLTSLDLRAMPSTALTPAALAAIPAALPHLQQLLLPCINDPLYQAACRALQACPHLHTLLATMFIPDGNTPHLPACWAILQDPPTTARLRSLTLTDMALPFNDTPVGTPLAAFSHLTHLHLCQVNPYGDPDLLLLHLLAAAPSLRSIQVANVAGSGVASSCLSAFTALTQLSVEDLSADEEARPPLGVLLHQFGALTALRSLALHFKHQGWDPAEAGWLSRLTLLTSLDIYYWLAADPEGVEPVVAEVAASLARLPALQRLEVSIEAHGDGADWALTEAQLAGGQPPGGIVHHLAAATQLRQLALNYLPAAGACLLTSLQGLTCLRLWHSDVPCGDLRWVSALTRLQHLRWDGNEGDEVGDASWQAVATLPRLRTLAVYAAALQQPLADLLVALSGRLECLQLAGGRVGLGLDDEGSASVLASLRGMQRLRVLDLREWYRKGWEGVLLAWLPRSLRQCYLPISVWRNSARGVAGLQEACPWVVLRAHERLDKDVW